MVMAPFTPFMAEELYRLLTGGESVHLLDWPTTGHIDTSVLANMSTVREAINQGLSKRAEAHIKARQPLSKFDLSGAGLEFLEQQAEQANFYAGIVLEELNVKQIGLHPGEEPLHTELDTEITPELRDEGIMRELVRFVQNARKDAGLNVEDRISLLIETESPEIMQAIETHKETVLSETLTEEYGDVPVDSYETTVKVEGLEVRIALAKR